jgi:hypothetical protein
MNDPDKNLDGKGTVEPRAKRARRPGSEYVVLEGQLTELHVEHGTQNLLAKIDAHYRGKSALTAAAAAFTDQFGLFASASNLALYDGEYTQNFACLVDDRLVYGQFSGAQFLKEGNKVKVVALPEGDVYLARGILDERQGYVWTGIHCGSRADTKSNFAFAKWGFLVGVAIFGIGTLAEGGLSQLRDGFSQGSLEIMTWGVGASFFLMLVMFLWCNRDTKVLTGPATEIFRALGFARPEHVDLMGFNIYWLDMDERTEMDRAQSKFAKMSHEECRDVYDYRLAIKKRKLKLVEDGESRR